MAGSKKKRSSTLIILLIAMIVMIGACFWLIRYKDEQAIVESEVETTEDTVTIASLDVATIGSIYYTNESGEITLTKDDEGVWKYSTDELFPVNQTYSSNMQNAFSTITSSRTITQATEDLSSYGLDTPAIIVVATTDDGTTTTISMGDEVPVSGGYYAKMGEGSEIYIVTAAFYNFFTYGLTDLIAVETIPSITAEYITHLTVQNKEKSNYEVSYDENNYSDFAGFTNWTLKQPYATEIPADIDAVTTVLGNYAAMSFLTCVDYNVQDLSKYGLDDPTATIDLEYYEEVEAEKQYFEYGLIIGSIDEAGNYYAKSKDSNAVHTMSADTVATLTTIDAYSSAYHYINLINIEAINKIDVDINGNDYTLSTDKSTETVDDVETEVTNYYFNGERTDETEFKTLYQLIMEPTTEREIPAEYVASSVSRTPYMTLTYHFNDGNTVTIQYIPYDESYYVVDTNGAEYFITDIRKINEIAEAIAEFQ